MVRVAGFGPAVRLKGVRTEPSLATSGQPAQSRQPAPCLTCVSTFYPIQTRINHTVT